MSILVKPIITEKATSHSELHNRYTFVVNQNSNKIEIKNAVEQTYGVSVEKVRTMNYPIIRKSKHTKKGVVEGKIGAYKKAIVELAEGQNIDFYSNI
ncbi:MAG: 50S ribosomal protein L23 [Flavobacteriaceae bacterium]|nr:50S ribosomal protein L23 [Flavobacteriaceae bacterium]